MKKNSKTMNGIEKKLPVGKEDLIKGASLSQENMKFLEEMPST